MGFGDVGSFTLDAFVSVHSPTDGTCSRASSLSGPDEVAASSVFSRGDGSLLVIGRFVDTLLRTDGDIPSAGGADIFAAELDTNLDPVWTESIGGTGDEVGRTISAHNASVVLSGRTNGSLVLGDDQHTASDGYDVFIVKYNSP